jgi:kynurenine formamidase
LNQLLDLSHSLEEKMTVFPGTEYPMFTPSHTIEENGYNERLIQMHSHVGTHIDAPNHIIPQGKTISSYSIDQFYGRGIVFLHTNEQPLNLSDIKKQELDAVDFVIFYTQWSKYWNKDNYFTGFPVPSQGIIEYLVSKNLKGVGIDAASIDTIDSNDLPNHHILLSSGLVIIENLTNLSALVNQSFEFFCFPLSIINGDGSPVRAVARLD